MSKSSIWAQLVGWGEDVEAFLGSFAKSEVTVIAPMAEQSIAELATEEAATLATGNAANTGHIMASVITSTASKIAQAGLNASPASLAGAVGAAVAKHQANATKVES